MPGALFLDWPMWFMRGRRWRAGRLPSRGNWQLRLPMGGAPGPDR